MCYVILIHSFCVSEVNLWITWSPHDPAPGDRPLGSVSLQVSMRPPLSRTSAARHRSCCPHPTVPTCGTRPPASRLLQRVLWRRLRPHHAARSLQGRRRAPSCATGEVLFSLRFSVSGVFFLQNFLQILAKLPKKAKPFQLRQIQRSFTKSVQGLF